MKEIGDVSERPFILLIVNARADADQFAFHDTITVELHR